VHDCTDGYVNTAPAGSFAANAFSIYDTLGNVFEWVEDCWNDGYEGAPLDGSAWSDGECDKRVLRGGSWFSRPVFVRSAYRNRFPRDHRSSSFGFRVAREIEAG
jgi:formylglycine-generating enzyme required for sulfatase activity